MAETGRFGEVLKSNRLALVLWLVLLGLTAVATVVVTVYCFLEWAHLWVLGAGLLLLLAEAASIACTLMCYGVVRVLVSTEAATTSLASRLERVETLLEDQGASTRRLTDVASLSDRAKSLIFRDREIETMREIVHDCLIRQDYRGAEALIGTVEHEPTYADEAANLRTVVAESRKATIDEKLKNALDRVQESLDKGDFARASRDAQRIMRAFGGNDRVAQLPQRIEAARAKRKRDLLQGYGEAVARNDVDRGIELLRELDKYLTPQEAAALQDSARGVFRARLHNLGVQFAIKVTEKQWSEAIAAGEEIILEYPNSRMAAEVRSKMEQLRTRAAEVR